MKYAARAALGAMVIYIFLGAGSSEAGVVLPARAASKPEPVATYWSAPSPPDATNTVAAQTQEQIVLSDENAEDLPLAAGGGKAVHVDLNTQEDVDDFIAKLLAEDSDGSDSAKAAQPPPPKKVLTEEEKAEEKRQKDLETQMKRKDITERHSKWEKRLKEEGRNAVDDLLEKVTAMRKDIVEKMRTTPEMFELLKTMQSDGMSHVHNTEKYLLKMQKEDKNGEGDRKLWETVLERVGKKVDEKTIEVTQYLQNWHANVMQKERDVVSPRTCASRDGTYTFV